MYIFYILWQWQSNITYKEEKTISYDVLRLFIDGECLCHSQIVKECNEGVRKMSRTEELISIEKTLEFKSKVNYILLFAFTTWWSHKVLFSWWHIADFMIRFFLYPHILYNMKACWCGCNKAKGEGHGNQLVIISQCNTIQKWCSGLKGFVQTTAVCQFRGHFLQVWISRLNTS